MNNLSFLYDIQLDVLHSSLRVLKTQTCKALNQMKDLFSDSRPANGIGEFADMNSLTNFYVRKLSQVSATNSIFSPLIFETIKPQEFWGTAQSKLSNQ